MPFDSKIIAHVQIMLYDFVLLILSNFEYHAQINKSKEIAYKWTGVPFAYLEFDHSMSIANISNDLCCQFDGFHSRSECGHCSVRHFYCHIPTSYIYHMNINRRLQSELKSIECHINTIRYLTHTYNTHKHIILRRFCLLYSFSCCFAKWTQSQRSTPLSIDSSASSNEFCQFCYFCYCWIINIKTCCFLKLAISFQNRKH